MGMQETNSRCALTWAQGARAGIAGLLIAGLSVSLTGCGGHGVSGLLNVLRLLSRVCIEELSAAAYPTHDGRLACRGEPAVRATSRH